MDWSNLRRNSTVYTMDFGLISIVSNTMDFGVIFMLMLYTLLILSNFHPNTIHYGF